MSGAGPGPEKQLGTISYNSPREIRIERTRGRSGEVEQVKLARFHAWLEAGGDRLQEVRDTTQMCGLGNSGAQLQKDKVFVGTFYVLGHRARPLVPSGAEELVQGHRSGQVAKGEGKPCLQVPSSCTSHCNPRNGCFPGIKCQPFTSQLLTRKEDQRGK